MIKNIVCLMSLFLISVTANIYSDEPFGLQELNIALSYFAEGNEVEGLQALQTSAKEGNYAAVLLHKVKGLKVPYRELNFESSEILQKIETLFWQRNYRGAFTLALENRSQFPDLQNELKIFEARSWFMLTEFGQSDLDTIYALYYGPFQKSKKSALAIEMAIVHYWSGDADYHIDRALNELNQVQDPMYIMTADLLRYLLQDPNFKSKRST